MFFIITLMTTNQLPNTHSKTKYKKKKRQQPQKARLEIIASAMKHKAKNVLSRYHMTGTSTNTRNNENE